MHNCWWNIKEQHYESVDLKRSIQLGLQSFIDNDRLHGYFLMCLYLIFCCC